METNEKVKKSGIVKVIIVLTLILTILILAGLAYARYITSINGNTQVAIAKWDFNVTAGSSQSLDIDLASTRLANDTQEVDRTKVAPGTAGALQLNINASQSQVSLKYDINLSLTQIPENLIFYSDSNMTKALYKDNGVIHLDGYFGASDTNKTATQNLYWQWKLETGSTQTEINSSDELDSNWMGDRIVLGIQATGRQVMDNPTSEYTVTFDLNGGKLSNHGDSAQVTKQVNYGETYGTLPIPTREGYTFVGWNGKNLFNKDKLKNIDIYTSYKWIGYANARAYSEILKPNTSYTISVQKNGYGADARWAYRLFYNENDVIMLQQAVQNIGDTTYSDFSRNFITDSSGEIIYAEIYAEGWIDEFNLWLNTVDIQLEEGSTATAYEPYYITSSTEVVQNQDHTLTAIWIED